jgi:hypothetical protein
MKLVQKILSHGLLIAFIVAAFFLVTNRAELFPQWFAKSQASAGKAVSERQPDTAAEQPAARTVTRPLPEKTLIKREGAAVPQVAPAGDEASGGETAAPLASMSAADTPVAEAPAPAAEITPPVAEAPAPAAEITPPVAEAPAPAAGTTPPVVEAPAPVAGIAPPVAEAPAPVAEIAPPVAEAPAPAAEITPPVAEAPAPAAEITPPVAEAPAPAAEITPPVAEAPAPIAGITPPVAEAPAPAAEITPPVAEITPPVAEAPASAEFGPAGETTGTGSVTAWQRREPGASAEPPTYRPLDEAKPAEAKPAEAAQEPPATETVAAPAAQQAAEPAASAQTTTPEAAAATAVPQTTVAAAAQAGGSASDAQLERRLEEVRALFWRRDLSAATTAYQSLGQAYPENAEVWGEIGNFYYSLREAKAATAAYTRAIELLVQQGDQPRARQLLGVVYRLDAAAARKLEMRLQQAGG